MIVLYQKEMLDKIKDENIAYPDDFLRKDKKNISIYKERQDYWIEKKNETHIPGSHNQFVNHPVFVHNAHCACRVWKCFPS
jgi:hypothetical protein